MKDCSMSATLDGHVGSRRVTLLLSRFKTAAKSLKIASTTGTWAAWAPTPPLSHSI